MLAESGDVPTTLMGALVLAIIGLAGTVAYLFRFYSTRQVQAEKERREHDADHARERATWAAERASLLAERATLEALLRAEYEKRHREMVDRLYEEAREFETTARREYAANMELVANKAGEINDKIGTILERFYERYVNPRRAHKE